MVALNKGIQSLSRAQMIEVDRRMIGEFGISLPQMMENAGRNLAEATNAMLGGSLKGKRIAVMCGGGSNGGGGMAAARHLANRGADVQIALVSPQDKLKEMPDSQLRILRAMELHTGNEYPEGHFDLLIDALIGYGLRGAPRGKVAEWIERMNESGTPVLSLDIPTGLDADTGRALGACIRAHATLTLAVLKTGMLAEHARPLIGSLYLADISVPPALLAHFGINMDAFFF